MSESLHTLKARIRTIEYALTNTHSSLYRDFYGRDTIPVLQSEADWEALPILTKELLVTTPFHKRLFSPLNEVDYVRTTSGTSGKNLLIIPKTRLHPRTLFDYEGSGQGGALTFLQPQHQWGNDYQAHGIDAPVLAGDPANLRECSRLAYETGVTVLRTFPFVMERHLPHLVETGLAEQLRVVILAGERLTAQTVHRYAEFFPNAKMIVYYAANELGGIPGIAPISKDDTEILYQPAETYHFELLDAESRVIHDDGIEGEIVLTTLWTDNNNLPLVRYATGDVALRARAEDGAVRYQVLGRKNTDRIKLPKGELRVEEVERALRVVLGVSTVVPFELHYHKQGQVLPKITIKLLDGTATGDITNFTTKLAQEIRISNSDSYATLIAEGFHTAIEVVFVPSFGSSTAKKKYFFVHEGA